MSNANKLYQLQHDLWRQYPTGISTIGPCQNKCGKSARGSHVCPDCLEKEFAEVIGPDKAREYHLAVLAVRSLERDMLK